MNKLYLLLISILAISSNSKSFAQAKDSFSIKAGSAKIEGRISSPNVQGADKILVTLFQPSPITGKDVIYKQYADSLGRFSINIKTETSSSLVALYTSITPEKGFFLTTNVGIVNRVDIKYNSNDEVEKISTIPDMNTADIVGGPDLMMKMLLYRANRPPEPLHERSLDYFFNYVKRNLKERLDILHQDTLLSSGMKRVIAKEIQLQLYTSHVFDYKEEMLRHIGRSTRESGNHSISNVDKSYYRFFKDFQLNDPSLLYSISFPTLQKKILQSDILGLPSIGDQNIASWLKQAKTILSDLVGFSKGRYYDILAANAYGLQLTENEKPLTE